MAVGLGDRLGGLHHVVDGVPDGERARSVDDGAEVYGIGSFRGPPKSRIEPVRVGNENLAVAESTICPALDLIVVRLGKTAHEREDFLVPWRAAMVQAFAGAG